MSVLDIIIFQISSTNTMFEYYNIMFKTLSYKIMIYLLEYIDLTRTIFSESNSASIKNLNEILIRIYKSKFYYVKQTCPVNILNNKDFIDHKENTKESTNDHIDNKVFSGKLKLHLQKLQKRDIKDNDSLKSKDTLEFNGKLQTKDSASTMEYTKLQTKDSVSIDCGSGRYRNKDSIDYNYNADDCQITPILRNKDKSISPDTNIHNVFEKIDINEKLDNMTKISNFDNNNINIGINDNDVAGAIYNEFSMDNYSLFPKFLFNNNFKFIYDIHIPKKEETIIPIHSIQKTKFIKKCFVLNKNYLSTNIKLLDLNLKQFYCYKVVLFRFSNFFTATTSFTKKVCQMCEKSFFCEELIIHYFFCKSRKMYLKKLSETKDDFKLVLQFLKAFKKKNLTKEQDYGIFSENSPFNLKLKRIKDSSDLVFNSEEEEDDNKLKNKPKDMLDFFIYIIGAEREKRIDSYERMPSKLISLNRLIHFTCKVLIDNQSKPNKDTYLIKLNDSLALLLQTLIKKEFLLVNLIQDNEKIQKLTSKKHSSNQKSVTISQINKSSNFEGNRALLAKTTNFKKANKSSKFEITMLTDEEKYKLIHTNKKKLTHKPGVGFSSSSLNLQGYIFSKNPSNSVRNSPVMMKRELMQIKKDDDYFNSTSKINTDRSTKNNNKNLSDMNHLTQSINILKKTSMQTSKTATNSNKSIKKIKFERGQSGQLPFMSVQKTTSPRALTKPVQKSGFKVQKSQFFNPDKPDDEDIIKDDKDDENIDELNDDYYESNIRLETGETQNYKLRNNDSSSDDSYKLSNKFENEDDDDDDGNNIENRIAEKFDKNKYATDDQNNSINYSSNNNSELSINFHSDSNSNINDLIELVEDEEKDKKILSSFNNPEVEKDENMNISIQDFQIIVNLSKGGYGSVDLCRKIKTDEKYAIKTVNISDMVRLLQNTSYKIIFITYQYLFNLT